MAPQYRLTYFKYPARGRAEIIRLVFAAAGVEYMDERIEHDAWPALKSKTPFGHLPTLEVDGLVLCQSITIARYLARKYDLAGGSELDQVRADMIVDCVEDIFRTMLQFTFGEKDESIKAELRKKFSEEQLPTYLNQLEKFLRENNEGSGYLVGSGLTWADLSVFNLADFLSLTNFQDALNKHPLLTSFIDRVTKEPKVAEWLAKRPSDVSDF